MTQKSNAAPTRDRRNSRSRTDASDPVSRECHDTLQGIAADVGVRCSPVARTKTGYTVFLERDEARGHQSFGWVTWEGDLPGEGVKAYASLYSHEKLEESPPRAFDSVEEAVRQLAPRMDDLAALRALPLTPVESRRDPTEPRLDTSGIWHIGGHAVGQRFGATVYARPDGNGLWTVLSNRWDRSRPRQLGEVRLYGSRFVGQSDDGVVLEPLSDLQTAAVALEAALASSMGHPGALIRFLALAH